MYIEFYLFSCLVGVYALPSRIVNGTDAVLGQIPYIVSIQSHEAHFCAGSILDETHILTAAHCIKGHMNAILYIQYGVIDIRTHVNRIRVWNKVYHQDYVPHGGHENDVAILTLEDPMQFGSWASRIILPDQDEDIPEHKPSILAGWGHPFTGGTGQKNLKVVELEVYSDDECEDSYHQADRDYHLCSGVEGGGKGQCNGDSGGPLYSEGKQIGVVSWSGKPCGEAGRPGVFTRVARYVNWIKSHMCNSMFCRFMLIFKS